MDIDFGACLRRGVIGAVGSVPGTLISHPFDVWKIRMQVSGDSLRTAFRQIHSINGVRGFYRGLLPAVEQRLATRGPMFLVSELYTQLILTNTSLSRTQATFVGSAGSGFTTGALASVFEYKKKILSQCVMSAHDARWDRLVMSAYNSGNMQSLWRRIRGAGICSAVYDSTFFGVEHHLHLKGFHPALSYGLAAAAAVVNAFALDSCIAQMMIIPPNQPCSSMKDTFRGLMRKGPVRTYRGLTARVMEFSCNYAVVGLLSTYHVTYMMMLSEYLQNEEC